MSFAPYGVFGLVAAVVAKTGFDAAGPLVTFSVAVLLVFDRILDMSRMATNVFGDACCTVIVSRLQGENLPALKANGKS